MSALFDVIVGGGDSSIGVLAYGRRLFGFIVLNIVGAAPDALREQVVDLVCRLNQEAEDDLRARQLVVGLEASASLGVNVWS